MNSQSLLFYLILCSTIFYTNGQFFAPVAGPFLQGYNYTHMGIVVSDLTTASTFYNTVFGVNVPAGTVTTDQWTVYRGSVSNPKIFVSEVIFFSNTTFKIIQPLDSVPSIWNEVLSNQGGPSFHHISILTGDIQTVRNEFKTLGINVVQMGYGTTYGCYIYFDATAQIGMLIEVVQKSNLNCKY